MVNVAGMEYPTPEQRGSFKPLPVGWYRCVIIESGLKKTSKGTGHYIPLKIQVIDGDHANRTLFANLNIQNPNETAEIIGKGQLEDIFVACRVPEGSARDETENFHNVPLMVKVKLDNRDADKNQVGGFKADPDFEEDDNVLPEGTAKTAGTPPESQEAPATTSVEDDIPAWQKRPAD